jgi:hypothetical protein
MIVANVLGHAIEEDSGTSFVSVQSGRMSGRGSEKETGNTPISTGAPNCKKDPGKAMFKQREEE